MRSFSKWIKENYLILVILSAALIFRIFLAFLSTQPQYSQNADLTRYQDWGGISYHHGLANSYTPANITDGLSINNQPPGTTYLNFSVYAIHKNFFSYGQESKVPITALLKLPSIASDLLIGLFIYLIVLRVRSRNFAFFASAIFLFNPVIFYNSALWGQMDAINNLFLYLSIYLLLGKKYFLATFAVFMSLFIKISLLPLLPLMLLFILKTMNFKISKFAIYVLISIGILLLLTLPISLNPFSWYLNFFLTNAKGELPYITNYAFNFWAVLFSPYYLELVPNNTELRFGLPLSVWANILFLLSYIPILIYAFKSKLTEERIINLLMIVAFAMFLLLPRMHERYLYPFFPLLATFVGLRSKNFIFYAILSVINFINLYVVWHPFEALPASVSALIGQSKARWSFSALTTLIFVIMYLELFKVDEIIKEKLRIKKNSVLDMISRS